MHAGSHSPDLAPAAWPARYQYCCAARARYKRASKAAISRRRHSLRFAPAAAARRGPAECRGVRETSSAREKWMQFAPVRSGAGGRMRRGVSLVDANTIVGVRARHVGKNHLFTDLQSFQNFHRADRRAPKTNLYAIGFLAVG